MPDYLITVILFLLSFIGTLSVYPLVLRFAIKHNIVDNPDARKLQRVPVPVMGGTAVFFGISISLLVGTFVFHIEESFIPFIAMAIMWLIGTIDDIKNLSATLRFVLEIGLVLGLMLLTGDYIDDFHGLFHVNELPQWIAIVISIIAGVGIINATNLIDGVDGYSSGFGITACCLFATLFFVVGDSHMAFFALIIAGALLTFFLHNVFGKNSKMFIGDGGTLMLGVAMTTFVFRILGHDNYASNLDAKNVSLVAFCLAVLAVPVFDTIRVMSKRILIGNSPFQADKTHLHHLFIDLGFSHVGTAVIIILMNCSVVLIWWLCWSLGLGIAWQVFWVVLAAVMITFVFYKTIRCQEELHTKFYQILCTIGKKSHIERDGFWHFMRILIDGRMGDKEARDEMKEAILMENVEKRKLKLDETMTPKERDQELILYYLEGKTNVFVEDIKKESGADVMRIYPILYELVLDGKVKVLQENRMGQMIRVKLA